MKRCYTCQQEKPLEAFSPDKSAKDGCKGRCRECMKQYHQQYYQANTDKIKGSAQSWRENNPERKRQNDQRYRAEHKEQITVYKQAWWQEHRDEKIVQFRKNYAANRDAIRAEQRRRYWANPEKYRAEKRADHHKHTDQRRQYHRSKYHQDRDRRLRGVASWQASNRDRVRVYKANNKAKRRKAAGRFTTYQWRVLCTYFGNVCLCCGADGPLTVDHVIPLARGGTNDIVNLQPLCLSCNCSKQAKTIDYRDSAMLAQVLEILEAVHQD